MNELAALPCLLTILVAGCLPKVDFTPCRQTDSCVVRDDATIAPRDTSPDQSDGSLDTAADLPLDGADDPTPLDVSLPPVDMAGLDTISDRTLSDAELDLTCSTSESRCGSDCVTLATDARHCGRCGNLCVAPTGGTAECRAGACLERCPLGKLQRPGACVPLPAPRLLWPPPTSHVSVRRPTFRWELAPGVEGARIEFCRTRDCVSPLSVEEFSGTSGSPHSDLPASALFWRARSMLSGSVSASPSAVWPFVVPTHSAANSSAYGLSLDFNGDGFADLTVWNPAGYAEIYAGTATGPSSTVGATLRVSRAETASLHDAGDVNGDGFSDVLVSANSTSLLFLGSATLTGEIIGIPISITDGGLATDATGIGDVNCDGYGDLVALHPSSSGGVSDLAILHGDSAPRSIWASQRSLGSPELRYLLGAMTFDLDTCSDILVMRTTSIDAYLGSRSGIDAAPTASLTSSGSVRAYSMGDVNGDGRSDFINSAFLPSPLSRLASTLYLSNADTLLGRSANAVTIFSSTDVPVGDVDGDGFADCVAHSATEIRVHRGGATGYDPTPFATLPLPAGAVVQPSIGADFNGDHFDDIVVASPSSLTIVLGGASAPLRTLPARTIASNIVAF